jgi:hypothetical protein
MRRRIAAHLLLLLLLLQVAIVWSAQALPWEDLLLRCSITSSSSDSFCALAQQSFKECDTLFGGDDVLLRACRAAAWAEGENHSLERLGTGTVSARWSSTPMGNFWFASASRADDMGLSATFEETLCVNRFACFTYDNILHRSMTPSMSTLLYERLRPICQVTEPQSFTSAMLRRSFNSPSYHSKRRGRYLSMSVQTWAGWLRWRPIGVAA